MPIPNRPGHVWIIAVEPLRLRRAGFRIYQADLAFNFRAEGGWIAARLGFTNGLLMNGRRDSFEIIGRGDATLAAEDREDDGRPRLTLFDLQCMDNTDENLPPRSNRLSSLSRICGNDLNRHPA